MVMIIFLDESGDLGWSFGAPYRKGGSSRYLTISAVGVSKIKRHLPGRLIRTLYKKYSWDPRNEKKWTYMNSNERLDFAKYAKKLYEENTSIKFFSITAYKPRVPEHIRKDSNKLYNYLIKLILLDEMAKHDQVEFYPDPRNIKISSGDSLSDYLQTELFFTKNVATKLITIPRDSASDKGVQFADMLSGLVQNHYENSNSEAFKLLASSIQFKTIYFNESIPISNTKVIVDLETA